MTILERRSSIRIKALKKLVGKGEYSPEYALGKLDDLNIKGLLTQEDYEATFDYLAGLIEEEIPEAETEEEPETSVEE